MSPLSRKEHDSIWIKATVPGACAELQAAVGSHARRRTSFPSRACVLHASPGPGGGHGEGSEHEKDEKHREKIGKGKLRQMESDQM